MQALTQSSVLGARLSLPANRSASGTRQAPARRFATTVVARVAPPKGVTQPPRSPVVPPPKFGFVDYAERINSRAAMIGFFALLLLEGVTNKGLLEMIGVSVGKGLNIGF